jgi:hypothetical protein
MIPKPCGIGKSSLGIELSRFMKLSNTQHYLAILFICLLNFHSNYLATDLFHLVVHILVSIIKMSDVPFAIGHTKLFS